MEVEHRFYFLSEMESLLSIGTTSIELEVSDICFSKLKKI